MTPSVSVLIPCHNGANTLEDTLRAVDALAWDGALEIVVVDDASGDESSTLLAEWQWRRRLRCIAAEGRGAASALNRGLEHIDADLVAQFDQDVCPTEDWLQRTYAVLEKDVQCAAVQGVYCSDARDGLLAAMAARDLEWRYRKRGAVTHVCTGNTLYRRAALSELGGFDERMGYGYDNDLSYRLLTADFSLAREEKARARHRFPGRWRTYLRKQAGVAYGRLDLVSTHRNRWRGDSVSGLGMISHAALTAMALLCLAAFMLDRRFALLGAVLLVFLGLERCVAALRATLFFGDWRCLLWPVQHALRDFAWVWAMARWTLHRLLGRRHDPGASMPRHGESSSSAMRASS
jgi:cellulose synthase/poly-beta-1,6-N-acetylglucosamine synthase-like glycosyltransferase